MTRFPPAPHDISRRDFLQRAGQLVGASAAMSLAGGFPPIAPLSAGARTLGAQPRAPQRIVVLMLDGFGTDYLEASQMPVLRSWMRGGLSTTVRAIMPTVTNASNASICCGCWPSEHGITGNSYFDEATGREEYMEAGELLLAPTLFERAAKAGVRSALLSCKKKTIPLLSRGAEIAMTAETPGAEWTALLGAAPDIYSREINYWLLGAARHVLEQRPEIGVVYVHTTDYPMHTWAPTAPESREHLARVDALLGDLAHAAPDAAFFLTADHGLNAKVRCWDVGKALANRGLPVRAAISAERDKYVQHHKGYGGTGWVYLNAATDRDRAVTILRGLKGMEAVLTREEAAARFHLPPNRIGHLMVLGDKETVFGETDRELEELPPEYRSHGSLHEETVPFVVHNNRGAPLPSGITHNWHLTRGMFR